MKKILTLLLVLFSATGYSQVVISQVYSGGGSGTAYYDYDYIELHNMGDAAADISAYVIKYASQTGNFPASGSTIPTTTTIPAGGYFLIRLNTTAGATPRFTIPTPDWTASPIISAGASAGKIVIFKGTDTLDLVGFGSGTTNNGTSYTNAPLLGWTKDKVGVRKLKGNINTKNNAADFDVLTVATPRNSSSLPFKKSNLSDVLISQVYPGGGNASSTYKNSYFELRNNGTDNLDISGFALQYATGTGDYGGSGNNYVYPFPAGSIIPAGTWILVQTGEAAGVDGGDIPTPDYTMVSDTISSTNSSSGKIAFAGTSSKLACGSDATPCGVNPFLLDSVVWGSSPLLVLADNKGLVRKVSGCINTGINIADFDVVTNPVPKNGATPAATCGALPLNLTSFSVQKAGSNVQINWSTAQEQNSKNFEVQRSTDQNNWSTVATVAATGSSNTTANYSATDYSPAQGVNYYRLKIVDADNSYTMSEVKSVNFASGFAVSISPNPASTYINVTLGGNGSSRVIMSDLNGKVVYNQTTTAPKLQINSSTFAKGMYIIKVVNGSDISTNKVIVQ